MALALDHDRPDGFRGHWDAAADTVVGTGANTAVRRKNNDSAAVAPTVNEDSGDGYSVGSRWIDTTADKEYVCLDATVGAAVWTETTGAGGGGSGGFDLDSYSIDATYGDDFTAASLSGSWTRRNYVAGDETYQVGKNATYLRISKAGQAAGDGYFRTAPAGDWTFAMKYIPRFFGALAPAWGLGVVDSAGTGVMTLIYSNPIAPLLVLVTTYSTYGGSYVQPGGSGGDPNISIWPAANWANERPIWVYLRKSGTSYFVAYSLDGETWSPESSALTWAGTVDRMAMMDASFSAVTSGIGTGSFVDVDWFNKIA